MALRSVVYVRRHVRMALTNAPDTYVRHRVHSQSMDNPLHQPYGNDQKIL
jgi:hypothetical protein